MQRVRLRYAPEGWACLREVSGHEEQAVSGTGLLDALALLDALLLDVSGRPVRPGGAGGLTAPDRDRLLAAVYQQTYGARVESTLRCIACEEPFDLDFRLADLLASLESPPADAPHVTVEGGGVFRLESGVRFRIPNGDEECGLLGYPEAEVERALLQACLVDADGSSAESQEVADEVQAGLEAIAAPVDTEVGATCPECGEAQVLRFDLQSYLLRSLLAEQPRLAQEVHRLASAYGWGAREILELPRSRRRALVALVEEELTPAGRGWR